MRHLYTCLIALAASVSLAAPAHAQLIDLNKIGKGIKGVKGLSESMKKIDEPQEILMGRDLAALVLGTTPLLKSPQKQAYVNRVGRWLALHSERPDLPWKFGVVQDNDANAYSMPGGYVLITSGMLDSMRNESELAGVLAHEIAHVVKKHQLEAIKTAMRNEALGDLGGTISTGNGLKGAFSKALVGVGRNLIVSGLSKEDEFEADSMAVVIAARSGYSPYGLVGVLQTLSAVPKSSSGDILNMNSTHPDPVARMQQLDKLMGTKLDAYAGVDDVPGFAAMRGRPSGR